MPLTIRLAYWLSLMGFVGIQSALAETPGDSQAVPVAGRMPIPHSQARPISVRVSGAWKLAESANFRCWCQLSDSEARQLAESCETWRTRLRATWISDPDRANWTPKCEVHVHPHRAAYNQILNRPGDMSVGSTIMNFDQGRTVQRRIDIRSDASDWSNAALPHELTHVVLGERFGGHALPRWADEGIAMLSESAEKHRERLESLQQILARQSAITLADLIKCNRVPSPQLRDAFYGQSLGLSSLLVRKSTPAKFADFVEESITVGVDLALERHYNLKNVAALQVEWNDWVKRPESITFVSLPIQVGKNANVASIVAP